MTRDDLAAMLMQTSGGGVDPFQIPGQMAPMGQPAPQPPMQRGPSTDFRPTPEYWQPPVNRSYQDDAERMRRLMQGIEDQIPPGYENMGR